MEDLNPVPPGSPHTRAPRSPGSGKPPPMWATCTKLKPELQQQNQNLNQCFLNLPRFTKGDSQPLPSNLVPLSSTHGNSINKPSNPKPKIQKSITDFMTKGKKSLHSIQLIADVTKKSNTRLVPTNRENTVKIAREILREIIYSDYPLKISPIFAHLKSKKPKTGKKPKKLPPVKNIGKN